MTDPERGGAPTSEDRDMTREQDAPSSLAYWRTRGDSKRWPIRTIMPGVVVWVASVLIFMASKTASADATWADELTNSLKIDQANYPDSDCTFRS